MMKATTLIALLLLGFVMSAVGQTAPDPGKPDMGRLHHQLFRVRGPAQEGEVGQAVQLGVGGKHALDAK